MKLIAADARGLTRMSAFAEILNFHAPHQQNYRGDALYAGHQIGSNDLPCAVCVRDCGIEVCFDSDSVRMKTSVWGDESGKAEWYIGAAQWAEEGRDGRTWYAGDARKYIFTFTRATANECHEFLRGMVKPEDPPFVNNLYED